MNNGRFRTRDLRSIHHILFAPKSIFCVFVFRLFSLAFNPFFSFLCVTPSHTAFIFIPLPPSRYFHPISVTNTKQRLKATNAQWRALIL